MCSSLARDTIEMMQNMEVIHWHDIDSIISRDFNKRRMPKGLHKSANKLLWF